MHEERSNVNDATHILRLLDHTQKWKEGTYFLKSLGRNNPDSGEKHQEGVKADHSSSSTLKESSRMFKSSNVSSIIEKSLHDEAINDVSEKNNLYKSGHYSLPNSLLYLEEDAKEEPQEPIKSGSYIHCDSYNHHKAQRLMKSPYNIKSSFRKYQTLGKNSSQDVSLNIIDIKSIESLENYSPGSGHTTPTSSKKEDGYSNFEIKLLLSPQLEHKSSNELVQDDFIQSLSTNFSYSTSLLLPQGYGSMSTKDDQADFLTIFEENIGRVETFRKIENYHAATKILKELLEEIAKYEKISVQKPQKTDAEFGESMNEAFNCKLYKIQIYNLLSMDLYDMKEYDQALHYANKVVELDQYNVQALYKAYQANSKLKRDAEAKSILKKVRKLMHFQPYSQSYQKIVLDNISISSQVSSSNNNSVCEGSQRRSLNINFRNSFDCGKSPQRFRMSQFFLQESEKSQE